jgi:hypothetical protein
VAMVEQLNRLAISCWVVSTKGLYVNENSICEYLLQCYMVSLCQIS